MNSVYTKYYTYVKPVFRTKQARTYSSLVFNIVAIALFSIFAIKPTVGTIISLQKNINDQQALLSKLEKKSQDLNTGKKNLDNMGSDQRSRIYTLVPNSTSLPCLIDNINYIASINQVTVTGLQFQPTPLEGRSRCVFTDADFTNISKKAATEQVEFTINVSGTYSNVGQFIASMGQMSRLVTLKSINLNKQEGQSMVASINGLGFYFLDEKQNTK